MILQQKNAACTLSTPSVILLPPRIKISQNDPTKFSSVRNKNVTAITTASLNTDCFLYFFPCPWFPQPANCLLWILSLLPLGPIIPFTAAQCLWHETQVPEANSVSAFFINWYQRRSLSVHFHCVDDHKKQVASRGISGNTQWLMHDQAMNIFNFQ